ncbi:MAG: hypothetical protein ACKOD2_10530 [Ilumatobacteraceae bacterium]
MTIRRGEDWGSVQPVPSEVTVLKHGRVLFESLNSASPPTVVGVLSGDLHRTISSSSDPNHYQVGAPVSVVPVDLIRVRMGGSSVLCAAHVVARRSWWFGEILVVAKAQFVGPWDVAPRSHPNDGWIDATLVRPTMGVRQRIAARKRLRTASHLPHPDIQTTRIREGRWEFRRKVNIWADGVRLGPTAWIEVECVPDALMVCV